MGRWREVGMGWVDIAHRGKSLHIAYGDIDAVMLEGFQGGPKYRDQWGTYYLWIYL